MKAIKMAGFVLSLLLVSMFFAGTLDPETENTVIIPINGVIVSQSGSFNSQETSADQVLDWINLAEDNPFVDAIIFKINSPGGAAIAGKEIATRISKVNKTTVAVIRDVGASAGYLIASATDYIIADELSITGSIGTTSSYLEFSGILDKYNVTYNRLVSGKYKDMGSPFRSMTLDEKKLLQGQIDLANLYFINTVAKNRDLDKKDLEDLEGAFFLGIIAKDYGLIDEFGNVDTALDYVKDKYGQAIITEYVQEVSFYDLLTNKINDFSFSFGKGISNGFLENKMKIN